MRIIHLFIFLSLSSLLCGCESDSLAMAGRFYHGNTTMTKDKSLKAARSQLIRAQKQYAGNAAKMALIYYVSGLLSEKECNYEEALRNYEKALTFYCPFLDANLHIAFMYDYMGKQGQRIKAYNKTLDILNKELVHIESENFPPDSILLDPHMKYFVTQNMIENSYNNQWCRKLEFKVIENNLLELREKIKKELNSIDIEVKW